MELVKLPMEFGTPALPVYPVSWPCPKFTMITVVGTDVDVVKTAFTFSIISRVPVGAAGNEKLQLAAEHTAAFVT